VCNNKDLWIVIWVKVNDNEEKKIG
jgi:hypothetical protein